MIVVSDTSPLNYLVLIGQIDILPQLFGQVLVPRVVLQELLHINAPTVVRDWAMHPPAWLELRSPTSKGMIGNLGAGESDAISLAQEIKADLILIDERAGTVVAKELGLHGIGTLGVIKMAAEQQLLSFSDAISALRQTTFRGPTDLIDDILRDTTS
ncbi:MAG TPA: hypothetical protein VFE46_06720 [Pirellulales bacterium]|jgi:predicted nucleic acid-binding protein|nr:hypothetical protein [Pirellulales bacterium]